MVYHISLTSSAAGGTLSKLDPRTIESLDVIFSPRSIAVIGASDVYEKWGYQVLASAKESSAGIERQFYAVNPNTREVHGETCYPSVVDIPDAVDLAVIAVPAPYVPQALRECVQKQVKGAIIITAGFAESDPEGAARQNELVAIARPSGLRFLGPNVMGHANSSPPLITTRFVRDMRRGSIGFASQSGNVGNQVLQYGYDEGIGFSKFAGTGNEADLTIEDMTEYLAQDKETSVIVLYIEGLRQGRYFLELAREITRRKPIVVLKSGRSDVGSTAVRSHTSALAGTDAVYDAAFKQSGVIRANSVQDLVYTASALCRLPLPAGQRVGVVVSGGGIGVLATDECRRLGLEVPPLSSKTMARLNSILPPLWSHHNPVDTIGGNTATGECILTLLDDENIDAVLCVGTPGLSRIFIERINYLPPSEREKTLERLNRTVDRAVSELDTIVARMDEVGKPVVICNTNPQEEALNPKIFKRLQEMGIYVYPTHEHAAAVIAHMAWYYRYRQNLGC